MRIASTIALVLTLVPLPGLCSTQPDSPFGVVCPWSGIKAAGIKWVRGGAGATALGNWANIEQKPGELDWTASDSELASELQQDILALPILGYTPKWASSDPEGKASAPPKDMLSYAEFARAFVSRYKGGISRVEIWNEPDIGFFNGTVDQYADMLKAGYIGAKLADPNIKVVFGGTAGVSLNFIEQAYNYGGSRYFDVMAVHPYQWGDEFNDEWFVSQLGDLRRLMNSHGDNSKPIWLTELGWSTGDKGITEDVQARLLVQAITTALSLKPMGVQKAFWFCIKDWGGPNYGLLRDDSSRKPAFQAYAVMTRTLEGAEYIGKIDVGPKARCHVFRRPGGSTVAVLWARTKEDTPITLRCANNRINSMTEFGAKSTLSATDGVLHITARPEPIYLFNAGLSGIRKPDTLGYAPSSPVKIDAPVPVWVSAQIPKGTSKPYAIIGDSSEVPFLVHNLSDRFATVDLTFTAPGAVSPTRLSLRMEPKSTQTINARITLRPDAKEGVYTVTAVGKCGGKPISTSFPLRVAAGHVIEFFANSTAESAYLFRNENSGGAPSVRFNGKWVYKFNLANAKTANVRLNVGANEARQWRVLASRDDKEYKEILSGASNRSWHDCDLSAFVPGDVYLKFEGNDQQLEELVLTWR